MFPPGRRRKLSAQPWETVRQEASRGVQEPRAAPCCQLLGLCPGPCWSPPAPLPCLPGARPLPAPLLLHSLRAGLASSKAGPIRVEAAMCQLVFRLRLCARIAPPPHLPKSTHPPFYPLLRAFWVVALHRGSQSGRLEPLAVGGGWTDSLGPLPGADGAAPTPLGAGTPSGPRVLEKEAAAPRRLTRAG